MECRKWIHHHSALPMVVKVTRASGFLVTTPPKIASIGAKPANCSYIMIIFYTVLRRQVGPFKWNKVTQSTTIPHLIFTVPG